MNRSPKFTIATLISLALTVAYGQDHQPLRLWYKQPACALQKDNGSAWKDDEEWLKALPLGNGLLGAMVFGDVFNERVQLNEKTLWSGSHDDNDNSKASSALPEIRRLLFEGKYEEATSLTDKTQICRGVGSGEGNGAEVPFGCYQTLGDWWLNFESHKPYSNYKRELNLEDAIVKVNYEQEGVHFQREYFVSAPANVLVIRLTANKRGAISFSTSLTRPERHETIGARGQIVMRGTLSNGKGGEGMEYEASMKVKIKGGKKTISGRQMIIEDADEVILYLAASTDYLPVYPTYNGRDYRGIVKKNLEDAYKISYDRLKTDHVIDHQKYYNRVYFRLAHAAEPDELPTDERLKRVKALGNDNFLAQLYFQYGRYLLISSARENTLPANLQGIWANKIQTPWNSDYHTNINVQMNYWLAENSNLSDIHLSLINFIRSIEKPATRSATVQFGLRGWCISPIVNVWGFTSPGENPSWGLTPGASGWICQHLWEHYLFTQDIDYLREVFPTLKNAAKFYLDWLIKDGHGRLVSGPSASPENGFLAPDGSEGTVSMGPSHDQQIIEELFGNVIQAAGLLNSRDEFINELETSRAQLLKTGIGSDGRVKEWAEPFTETEPGHRHFSHLYGLYPGSAFNTANAPDHFAAARKSLEYRLSNGSGQTGWSAAWAINLWARLKEGEEALKYLNSILAGKSAENLFNLHPPFQIDGNFGAAAGIAEMLLQSHEGFIELLPALPRQWTDGKVKGLCARGNFVVDMEWRNGEITSAIVSAGKEAICKVKYKDNIISFPMAGGTSRDVATEIKRAQ